MKKLLLTLVLPFSVAIVAACTNPTAVCLKKVVVLDSLTEEPVTDIPLYTTCDEDTIPPTDPAIHPPR